MNVLRENLRRLRVTLASFHHRFAAAAVVLGALAIAPSVLADDTRADSAPGDNTHAETATSPSEPLPPRELPRLVLAAQASLTLGMGTLGTRELGGAVLHRLGEATLLGGHLLVSSGEVANGFSGCESATFCINDRLRFGLSAERHFGPSSTFDGWVGLDLEAMRARGGFYGPDGSAPKTQWAAVVVPKVGLDLVGRWPRGLAGAGVFAAFPVSSSAPKNGWGVFDSLGITLGVRAPFAFF